jgi:hypothetical protein
MAAERDVRVLLPMQKSAQPTSANTTLPSRQQCSLGHCKGHGCRKECKNPRYGDDSDDLCATHYIEQLEEKETKWEKEKEEEVKKGKRELEDQRQKKKATQTFEKNTLPSKHNTEATVQNSRAAISGDFTSIILLVSSDLMSRIKFSQLPAHIPSLRQRKPRGIPSIEIRRSSEMFTRLWGIDNIVYFELFKWQFEQELD